MRALDASYDRDAMAAAKVPVIDGRLSLLALGRIEPSLGEWLSETGLDVRIRGHFRVEPDTLLLPVPRLLRQMDVRSPVNAVALGRLDGRDVVVSGSWDGNVRVWDPAGDERRVLTGHTGSVRGVAIWQPGWARRHCAPPPMT